MENKKHQSSFSNVSELKFHQFANGGKSRNSGPHSKSDIDSHHRRIQNILCEYIKSNCSQSEKKVKSSYIGATKTDGTINQRFGHW